MRGVFTQNGRIVELLDDTGVRARRGLGISIDELDGIIFPGLTDSHSHPVLGAVFSRGVELTHVKDLTGLAAILAAERERTRDGDWILGWGLPHNIWQGRDPHRSDIDAATQGLPCAIRMFDAHSMLVNTAALHRARIEQGHTFATGSCVSSDPSGVPTGFLLESEAMELLDKVIPEETDASVNTRLREILDRMSASGLTGAHVMDANNNSAGRYAALEREETLPLRLKIHQWITPDMSEHNWRDAVESVGSGGARWSHHGVKLFLDGTIDNGTAWLRTPDRDGRSLRSAWDDPSQYRAAISYFARHQIGTATHAIGDAATEHAASVIQAARKENPLARHRIEHLELSDDRVIEAVRTSGAVASVQPTHCTHFVAANGSDNWSQRVGSRANGAWRVGSFKRAGIPLAIGSDWPIAHFAPLPIIAAAELRRPAGSDDPPVMEEESLPAADSIAGYTSGAAYAAGVEDQEGRIAPGYRCDLTLLERDPLGTAPDDIPSIRVTATVIDGRVAYARSSRV